MERSFRRIHIVWMRRAIFSSSLLSLALFSSSLSKTFSLHAKEILNNSKDSPDLIITEVIDSHQWQLPACAITSTSGLRNLQDSNEVTFTTHAVKRGETLWGISRKYGVDIDTIVGCNEKIIRNPRRVRLGYKLKIPSQKGILYTVRSGNTLSGISKKYRVELSNIVAVNNLSLEAPLRKGTTLFLPGAKLPKDDQSRDAYRKRTSKKYYQYASGRNRKCFSINDADFNKREIVEVAREFLGVPYKYGGTSDKGIDCSALVKCTFNRFGVALPRTAQQQFKVGIPVEELQTGDLVFFAKKGRTPTHVGIYIGNGEFIHASSGKEKRVVITDLNDAYYKRTFVGATRVVQEKT